MGKQLKAVLASGRVARVFGLGQLNDPKLIEMIGLSGGCQPQAPQAPGEWVGLSSPAGQRPARGSRPGGGIPPTARDARGRFAAWA